MFSFLNRRGLVAGLFALAALVAPHHASAQQCEDPKVLRFSLIPTQDSIRELTYYKPILDLLA